MWAFWMLIVVSAFGYVLLISYGLAGSEREAKAYGASDVLLGCFALVLLWIAVSQVLARIAQ